MKIQKIALPALSWVGVLAVAFFVAGFVTLALYLSGSIYRGDAFVWLAVRDIGSDFVTGGFLLAVDWLRYSLLKPIRNGKGA